MHGHEVTNALVPLMSLNKPGALYDAARAPDLQDVPVMAKCDPDALVWQEQALKTQAAHPSGPPSSPGRDTDTATRGSRVCPYPTKVRSKYISTTT